MFIFSSQSDLYAIILQLTKKYKKKIKDEEKASGINPQPTELDQVLEEILEMEEVAENEQDVDGGKRKEKEEADKHKAENMRRKRVKLVLAKRGGEVEMRPLNLFERKAMVRKLSGKKNWSSNVNNKK